MIGLADLKARRHGIPRAVRLPDTQFSDLVRMLQDHGAPLAREFCSDTEKFDGRPNRRKPPSELNSKFHVTCATSSNFSGKSRES